jgi:hypothetical protein
MYKGSRVAVPAPFVLSSGTQKDIATNELI